MFGITQKKKHSICLGGDNTSPEDDAKVLTFLEEEGISFETWVVREMFWNGILSKKVPADVIDLGLLQVYFIGEIGKRYKSQRWDNCMARLFATALQRVDWVWLGNWLKRENQS